MEELSDKQYPRNYFDPFGDELDDPDTEALVQCDVCCDWFPENDLLTFGNSKHICESCAEDMDEDVLVSGFNPDDMPTEDLSDYEY